MVNSRRFGWGPRTALSRDRDLDQAENVSLEVDSRHVTPREGPFIQRLFLSLQNCRVRLHASDQQIGVQKIESGFRISTFVNQSEARPGLCQFDLQRYSRQ